MLLIHLRSNILVLLIDDDYMEITFYRTLPIRLIHPCDTARSILMTSTTHYGYKP